MFQRSYWDSELCECEPSSGLSTSSARCDDIWSLFVKSRSRQTEPSPSPAPSCKTIGPPPVPALIPRHGSESWQFDWESQWEAAWSQQMGSSLDLPQYPVNIGQTMSILRHHNVMIVTCGSSSHGDWREGVWSHWHHGGHVAQLGREDSRVSCRIMLSRRKLDLPGRSVLILLVL